MSSLCMRMQPYDAERPIEFGALVPWIAYSPPPLSVMAAAPIGFSGVPPGMTSGMFGLSRRTSAGGDHAGLMNFPSIVVAPVQVLPGRPTATG